MINRHGNPKVPDKIRLLAQVRNRRTWARRCRIGAAIAALAALATAYCEYVW